MAPILQAEFFRGSSNCEFQIKYCRIVFIRYKPSHYLHVSYELDFVDTSSGHPSNQIICGKVFASQPTRSYLNRRTRRIEKVPDCNLSYVYAAQFNMLLIAFPNDLRLHNLPQLMFSDKIESIVRTTLDIPSSAGRSESSGASVQIFSYRPERYCLFRCTVEDTHPVSCKNRMNSVFVRRIHDDWNGGQIHQAMLDLHAEMKRYGGRMSVAEPLGYYPGDKLLIQSFLQGTTLSALSGRESFLSHIAASARCLANIHQTPTRVIQSKTPSDDLRDLVPMLDCLRHVLPEASEKLERLLVHMSNSKPPVDNSTTRLIHGDFSPNQILVDNDKLGVIDFSGCRGDPHVDLGNFLARLELYLQDTRLAQASSVFSDQYEAEYPGILDRELLRWHHSKALIRRGYTSLKKLYPNWPRRVNQCLSRAESVLRSS